MIMKVVPPEIVENIVEILSYIVMAAVGWIAKHLQGKNKNKKDDCV